MLHASQVLFFALLLCLFSSSDGMQFRSCGNQGICVSHSDCSFYVQLTNAPAFPFYVDLRNHICGYVDVYKKIPKVCCLRHQIKKPTFLRGHCGSIPIGKRIMHGSDAQPGEFPWMALIAFESDNSEETEFKCGGTLINKRYVLTAAHCLEKSNIKFVRLGEYNTKTKQDCDYSGKCEPPLQDVPVSKIISHPKYNPLTYENDIGLIKLKIPANIERSNVQPICLPDDQSAKKSLIGKSLTAVGWGLTESNQLSSVLKKVPITVKPLKTCLKLYRRYEMRISDKQICANGPAGQDACDGDSGGPLQHIITKNGLPRYVQSGIISYGPMKCGLPEQPSLYTKVEAYMAWILNNTEIKNDA